MIVTRSFASKSNPGLPPHQAAIDTDTGAAQCSCNGYLKRNSPVGRFCTHSDGLRVEFGYAPLNPDFKGAAPTKKAATTFTVVRKQVAAALQPTLDTIAPMLASALPNGKDIADYENDPAWWLEEKWDGWRLVIRRHGTRLDCWRRPRAGAEPIRHELPARLVTVLMQLPDCVVDSELRVPGGTSSDVPRLDKQHELVITLFDALEVMGESVMARTNRERRQLLDMLARHITLPGVTVTPIYPVRAEHLSAIWAAGGEGAILKRAGGTYRPGYRSADWVKVKRDGAVTLTITGYEAGKSGPYSKVLLTDGRGLDTSVKVLFAKDRADMARSPKAFIGRQLVVAFCEKTSKGKLRHGVWDHLVEAKAVRRG